SSLERPSGRRFDTPDGPCPRRIAPVRPAPERAGRILGNLSLLPARPNEWCNIPYNRTRCPDLAQVHDVVTSSSGHKPMIGIGPCISVLRGGKKTREEGARRLTGSLPKALP